jgi:hypothetical protein
MPPQRMLADRVAAVMPPGVSGDCRLVKLGIVALRCALVTSLSTTIAPGAARAQADCNRIDASPEVLDVRSVGTRLVRFYVWPSKRLFYIETASDYAAAEDERKSSTRCFASEPLSGDRNDASTIRLSDPDIANNSSFRIHIFWADLNQNTIAGKAGDIIAARCTSMDQTEQCSAWRRIGGSYKLFSDWPYDWR